MRFNTQDITGSQTRIRYSVDLNYEISGTSTFLFNVHAAQTVRQSVVEEVFATLPCQPFKLDHDPVTGNRIASLEAGPLGLQVRYAAVVDIAHRVVDPEEIVAEVLVDLPIATLQFLYPSRYCQADLVQQQAWDRFGGIGRGYAQVREVRNWVHQTLRFEPGTSHSATSVVDTLRDGVGVCRDFAHAMIACCRALNYPARFVTGVDYGADPALGPPDFHAYVEVFVGGAWYLFDPTGISPVTGLIRIGTGRDASDVSFATIFGPVQTGMPIIQFGADDDPMGGFVLPTQTELAISTAD